MKKLLIVAMLAGVSLTAHAKDEVVGTLSGVKGIISVSGNGFVSKAANGTAVHDGSKLLVSTDGRATVNFKDGCSVSLSGGQHMTVDTRLTCGQQQAAVQQLAKPYRLAQAPLDGLPSGGQGAGGSGAGGAGGGGAGGAGGAIGGAGAAAGITSAIIIGGAVDVNNTEDKNSPN